MAVLEQSKADSALTPLEWLAIKLVGKHADEVRGELQPGGAQEVDVLLRIKGKISIADDTSASVPEKPKLNNLLGQIIKHMTPGMWDMIRGQLIEAAQGNGGVLPGVEEGYAAKANALVNILSKPKVQPRKGACKGSFAVGTVDEAQLSPTASANVQKLTRMITLEDVE
jgi:hypothetical protein